MTLSDYLQRAYPNLGWYQRDQAFAERLGTNRQNIGRYRTFQRWPKPEHVALIWSETGGRVTANDHMPPTLLQMVEKRIARRRAPRLRRAAR